jgi:hypothetical protein
MRRILFGVMVLLLVGGVAYWRSRRNVAPLESAYVGERNLTVWSSNAQVRESLQILNFGNRVDILRRSGDNTEVRTPSGVEGWVATSDVIPGELWKRMTSLTVQARTMPVQAWAHTKVLSNLRVEPGRDGARVFQVGRDTKVAILGRKVLDVPSAPGRSAGASGGNANNGSSSNGTSGNVGAKVEDDSDVEEPATTRKEDWILVLADVRDVGQVAGWVVARFVQMDLPQPLPDYASSAGMRVSAWFELNRVNDPAGGTKPQYILFGSRGPEGDACDFSTMRAYTWGAKRERYETAYVESGFCGQMPVIVTPATQPGGDATFRFEAVDESQREERVYRMHQTIIRRIDEQHHEKQMKHKKRVIRAK